MALLQINAARTQFVDANGVPLTGGTVTTYIPSSTTPVTTYQDPIALIQNTNPITLDSLGSAAIWYSGPIRMVVKDALGNQIYDQNASDLIGFFDAGKVSWAADRTTLKTFDTFTSVAYLAEAGREGEFVFRLGDYSASVALDTLEGVYVKANAIPANVGAWVRADLSHPHAEWWGAKGDGVTNDTAAWTAAFNFVYRVYGKNLPSGYKVSNLVLPAACEIIGEGGRMKFVSDTTNDILVIGPLVSLVSFIRPQVLKDIIFDMSNSTTSTSTAINLKISAGVIFDCRFSGLDFTNCYSAALTDTHATNYVVDVYFQECNCTFTRGRQFYFGRSRGFLLLRGVRVDHTYNPGIVTWEGIRIEDSVGVELERVDVVGPTKATPPAYQPTAIGIFILGVSNTSRNASVWLRRVLVDNSRGPAIQLTNLRNVFMVDVEGYQNFGPQISINNCDTVEGVNIVGTGCISQSSGLPLAGASPDSSGLNLVNVTSAVFSNLRTIYNYGIGLFRSACTKVIINGHTSYSNYSYGVADAAASDKNLILGADYHDNNGAGTALDAFIMGANSRVKNFYKNDGSFNDTFSGTGGGATF